MVLTAEENSKKERKKMNNNDINQSDSLEAQLVELEEQKSWLEKSQMVNLLVELNLVSGTEKRTAFTSATNRIGSALSPKSLEFYSDADDESVQSHSIGSGNKSKWMVRSDSFVDWIRRVYLSGWKKVVNPRPSEKVKESEAKTEDSVAEKA